MFCHAKLLKKSDICKYKTQNLTNRKIILRIKINSLLLHTEHLKLYTTDKMKLNDYH